MATELTSQKLRTALGSSAPVMQIPARLMLVVAAVCVVIAYGSLLAVIAAAHDREQAAEARYSDARTIIEVPGPPIGDLQAELEAARTDLAAAEARVAAPLFDPASDEATSILVRQAQSARVSVRGIARVDSREAKVNETPYSVEAVRITVSGSTEQIGAFLYDLYESAPGLVPTLNAMTFGPTGLAEAEIVFSVYTKIEATPEAGGP